MFAARRVIRRRAGGFENVRTLSGRLAVFLENLTHGFLHPDNESGIFQQTNVLHGAFHERIPAAICRHLVGGATGRRGSLDGGAPVQLLHDFPGDIRLGHVLKLRVRSELLLCNFVHARKEGRHPFLQDSQRGRGKLSTHRLRAETSGTHTLSKFLQQLPPEAVELARLLEPGTPERTINV